MILTTSFWINKQLVLNRQMKENTLIVLGESNFWFASDFSSIDHNGKNTMKRRKRNQKLPSSSTIKIWNLPTCLSFKSPSSMWAFIRSWASTRKLSYFFVEKFFPLQWVIPTILVQGFIYIAWKRKPSGWVHRESNLMFVLGFRSV